MKKHCAAFTAILLLFQSCIKKAPLNPEADIETFTVDPALLTSNVFIDQSNRRIMLHLQASAYNSGIAPVLKISGGATVVPASGDSIFPKKGPVQYVVTPQNGEGKKTYTVQVVNVGNWSFNFENWGINATDKYEYPLEADNTTIWSSGNPGLALSGFPKNPEAYPTHSTADGYQGKGAEMVTLKGTPLSELVGIRLIAGSLFLGNFNTSAVFVNPLAATEFGQPYVGKPARFTGYYKYTPGAAFQDQNGNIIPGQQDKCSVYAVLFKGPEHLDGTNILTSDRILARATLTNGAASSSFLKFDIPFTYTSTAPLPEDLRITIVASSSSEGDHYRGAIGSKLVVDSLRIIPQ